VPKWFDLQDALLVLGILFIVGGIGAWSRPAASIILGLFCLGFVRLIARSRAPGKPEGKI
jgi:hypothetical protein